jgi:hypothetical protein
MACDHGSRIYRAQIRAGCVEMSGGARPRCAKKIDPGETVFCLYPFSGLARDHSLGLVIARGTFRFAACACCLLADRVLHHKSSRRRRLDLVILIGVVVDGDLG